MGTDRVTFQPRPHTTSEALLRKEQQIYRQGKTPIFDRRGRLGALDARPAGAETTGRHLGEIGRRFGTQGLSRSVRGLHATRGSAFAHEALAHAPASVRTVSASVLGGNVEANIGEEGPDIVGAAVGSRIGQAIDRSSATGTLPEGTQVRLDRPGGHRLDKIRIHDDSAAHTAARMLDARAFTVGRSIYFAAGTYRPATKEGMHLLAHEVAHTVQQGGARKPASERLTVTAPASREEDEADAFARAVTRGDDTRPPLQRQSVSVARVMRQTFRRTRDDITTNNPGAAETAATFQIGAGVPARPYFNWESDVEITGNAGDPFGNFEVGPHQVVRAFWLNIWWGTGANRTHRTSSVTLPIRDVAQGGVNWYHDPFVSAPFAASGDVRTTRLEDTPGVTNQPLANPVAGRVSTRGWFNWGMAFVAFISARDRTAGFGANAFQHLGHLYWNLSLAGNFDTTRPVNNRVVVTDGGRTNRGGVIDGRSREFPAMHGGDTFNAQANANLTTT